MVNVRIDDSLDLGKLNCPKLETIQNQHVQDHSLHKVTLLHSPYGELLEQPSSNLPAFADVRAPLLKDAPALKVLNQGAAYEDENRKEDEQGKTNPGPKSKSKTPALDQFGRDLTDLARGGKLDPVIGRENEIERITQILCRKTKGNPVILGDAGVGKTAIVEGFAQRIVSGNVPEDLLDKRVIMLDLAGMVAGTKYRGEFEERIKNVMNEVRRAKNVILFIDELHTVVGAGGAEGAIDASNTLKPALARGEIRVIGATTLDEYRKHIEKDSALSRRFQEVIAPAPTNGETKLILRGLRGKYEQHHYVRFTDDALDAAVELSTRYISGRNQPDKAIDVIDEAGARARLKASTPSTAKKEELAEINKLIAEANAKKEEAVGKQSFEDAAKYRGEVDALKKKKAVLEKPSSATPTIVEIDRATIEEVVASISGKPLARQGTSEDARALALASNLKKVVIGQDEACDALGSVIKRARSGLRDPKRPLGVFIFAGPTGTGKTHTAKMLAKEMFGDADAMVALDMSEYMEKHNVSRLIGAPPGYVGFEEGGQLTEKIRRKPYSVVLCDEIEKAHPDVFNMFLQVLEEGKLTDSTGRKVDFSNTLIIFTTNLGAMEMERGAFGFDGMTHGGDRDRQHESLRTISEDAVAAAFRPEFLNRVDKTITFKSLGEPELRQIIDLELAPLRERLAEKNLTIDLTVPAMEFLIRAGTNPQYGARPLRRAIESHLTDELSELILSQAIVAGDVVRVEHEPKAKKLSFVPLREDEPNKKLVASQ